MKSGMVMHFKPNLAHNEKQWQNSLKAAGSGTSPRGYCNLVFKVEKHNNKRQDILGQML